MILEAIIFSSLHIPLLFKYSDLPLPEPPERQTSPKRDALANLTPKIRPQTPPNMISIPTQSFPTATHRPAQPQLRTTLWSLDIGLFDGRAGRRRLRRRTTGMRRRRARLEGRRILEGRWSLWRWQVSCDCEKPISFIPLSIYMQCKDVGCPRMRLPYHYFLQLFLTRYLQHHEVSCLHS